MANQRSEEELVASISNHSFDSWAKELMENPPVIDEWQKDQVGEKNNGPYRQGYQNLPIKECHEQLVNVAGFGLVSWDYYLNRLFDGLATQDKELLPAFENRLLYPFAWVRESVAIKLRKADQLLRKHDLFLVVNSGWRHSDIQNLVREMATRKVGTDLANQLFANPNTGVSPHSTGGACDVQLWSLQTQSHLDFTYKDDDYSFYNLEVKQEVTPMKEMKKKVRRILYHVLCTPSVCFSEDEVFTIHPGEFWHFGDGDPLSSYLKKLPFAKFGPTAPPANFRMTHFS